MIIVDADKGRAAWRRGQEAMQARRRERSSRTGSGQLTLWFDSSEPVAIAIHGIMGHRG